jgi:hypothetical protein
LLEPLPELTRHVRSDVTVPVQELAPERHALKSSPERVRGRKVRLGKQTTVRLEIVEPGRAHDPEGPRLGALGVLEERLQLGQPLVPTGPGQRGLVVRFGILKVQANPVGAQPPVREATEGGHDRWRHPGAPRDVELIGPFATVAGPAQTGQVFLPARVRWIEIPAQSETDVEVRVL